MSRETQPVESPAKALVLELIEDGFGRRDPAVFHRLVAEDYIQHNPLLKSGREGLLDFLQVLDSIPDNTFTISTMLEEGPYVAVHAVWHANEVDHAVIDLFRVENGLLREHWDSMQEIGKQPANEHPAVGPPTAPRDLERTAENSDLVARLAANGLVGGDLELIRAACAETLVQHEPGVADGPDAFVADLKARQRRYARAHHLICQGDLALFQAEGSVGGSPAALYHLFRLAAGRIEEHWSVVQTIPPTMAHNNGMF